MLALLHPKYLSLDHPFQLLIFLFFLFSPCYFCRAAFMWHILSLASSPLSSLCLSLPGFSVSTPSRCCQGGGAHPPILPLALTRLPLIFHSLTHSRAAFTHFPGLSPFWLFLFPPLLFASALLHAHCSCFSHHFFHFLIHYTSCLIPAHFPWLLDKQQILLYCHLVFTYTQAGYLSLHGCCGFTSEELWIFAHTVYCNTIYM